MVRARALEGMSVFEARRKAKSSKKRSSPWGKRFGVIDHVLFHPDRPYVVGFEVRRPPWLYVIQRKPAYVPLDEVEIGKESLRLRSGNVVKDRAAEKRYGFEWDKTVIWVGMPVVTKSRESAGQVRDVSFSASGGTVHKLHLTGGLTADIAVGTKTIEGSRVVGFDGSAIVIEDVLEETDYAGGVAKHAGKGAAVAKVHAQSAARTAIAAGKAGAKVAGQSEIGRRAMRGLKAFTKAAKEAMSDEDDD